MASSGKSHTRKHTPETTPLWGGALCLDFANTVDWEEEQPLSDTDVIADGGEARRWGRRLGALGSTAAPIDDAELAALHGLREALHHAFSALARGDRPAPADLRRIQDDHCEAAGSGRLAPQGDPPAWRLAWPAREPRSLRLAIATDAIRLLEDAERVARVKRCAGRRCGWLFVDRSGRRRWCSMATCGSRTKMRRLYRRRRAARTQAA
ncbi:MAG: CGNR zinc finger domain-containing protein [Solirubrobacterales bacterium]